MYELQNDDFVFSKNQKCAHVKKGKYVNESYYRMKFADISYLINKSMYTRMMSCEKNKHGIFIRSHDPMSFAYCVYMYIYILYKEF